MVVKARRALVFLMAFVMIATSLTILKAPNAYAEGGALDAVIEAIGNLSPEPTVYTAGDRESVEAIQSAFEALSAEDQAVVDSTFNHPSGDAQSYGRILEAAVWAVRSFGTDAGTTLADGTYTTTTDPAVSSESSKGKSDSSRTRNWWVESVVVENGHATAYIYVTSGAATASKLTSYPSIWYAGNTIARNADNNYPIPVDLNGITYFGGISSSMPRPIMYALSTTINETVSAADYTAVDAALAMVPENLNIYTDESAAAVTAAVKAVVRGLPASRQAEVDAMAAAIVAAVEGLVKKSEPVDLQDGIYTLPELEAGPSAAFNHFVSNSRFLIVDGDTATIRFITDGSTASIQKYSRIALGKSSEILPGNYRPDSDLPEGTTIIDGVLQPYSAGTADKYLFEIPITKAEAKALLDNKISEDIYITVWNKVGSSADKIPGWYQPSNDIYLSLGTLGEAGTIPETAETFGFSLQVGQYTEGADFHTASFEGVEYALKDAAGNLYDPYNTTTGSIYFRNLDAANTYTFTATKEGWAVAKQGKWNEEAHAYEYIFLKDAEDNYVNEINVEITKDWIDQPGHGNITDSTNPGMVFRKISANFDEVDELLKRVPEDLSIFTEETAQALQTAVNAVDRTATDKDAIDAMADALEAGLQGLIPKDGRYEVELKKYNGAPYYLYEGLADNDKNVGKGVLVVEDGKMTLEANLKNQSYAHAFLGTKDEAIAAATAAGDIPAEAIAAELPTDKITINGKEYTYSAITLPVSALETDIAYSYHSKSKSYNDGWYDHGVMFLAASLVPLDEPVDPSDKIELNITNNLTMFKAVTAHLEKADEKTTLVMALSGTGYEYLFKGTYEEAMANGDHPENWIAAYKNDAGKLEFRIPLAEGETYLPLVAVSKDYYGKYKEGKNTLERAFYPRQAEVNEKAKTLVTGDYEFSQKIAVTNNVRMMKVKEEATLDTVGGPNSNNYKADLILAMENENYNAAYVGNYAEASEATAAIALEEGNIFTIPVKWLETFGKPESLVSLANGEPFYLSLKGTSSGKWTERIATLDEAAGTLVLDPSNADYTAVNEAKAAAEAIDSSIYTEESLAAVDAAVAAVVTGKFKSQQAEVDAMAQAIEDAIAALEKKPADYSAVEEAKSAAAALDRSLYTEDSLAAVDAAVSAVVEGKKIDEQAEVDTMAKAINDAIAALALKPADYSAVDAAKAAAEALDRSLYTEESLAVVDAAVAAVVEGKKIDEQAAVNAMAKAINDAIAALEKKPADYSAVEEAKSAAAALDRSLYTEDSLAAVDAAVAAVVEGKKIDEQAAVDAMAKAINDAIEGLKLLADYSAVEAAKAKVPADLSIYTDETAKAVTDAVNAVVEGKSVDEQDAVNAMAKAIEEAIAALEKKPADYSKVKEALDKVPADMSIYTEETAKAVTEAIAAVEEGKKIDEQAAVDAMAKAIEDALAKLEYRSYTITWLDEDGKTVLATDEVKYGDMPVYKGKTPEKAADEAKKVFYTFEKWSPDVAAVTGAASYKAVYKENAITYVFDAADSASMTWTMGSDADFNFTVHRTYLDGKTIDHFESIEMDGKKLEKEKDYSVASGSLKGTIKAAYMKTLSEGKHTLKVNFDDGSVETAITVAKQTPADTPADNAKNADSSKKTGDESNMTLWIILLAAALIGGTASVVAVKRKKESK